MRGGAHSNGLTLEEKQAVADCVKEAIQAGAVGFSTNRFSGHRDTSGVLVPGTLADVDEVVMIAKAVAEGGGGIIVVRQQVGGHKSPAHHSVPPHTHTSTAATARHCHIAALRMWHSNPRTHLM